MRPYSVLKSVLALVEEGLTRRITIEELARVVGISQVHLQRIFKSAFKIPIARYIRLRKLSVGLERLAFSDYRVIDVASELGFEHEQSFIRCFKGEFGITPSRFKGTGVALKATPALTMKEFISTSNGIIHMPDVVVLSGMELVGRVNYNSQEEALEKAPRVAMQFWEQDRPRIKNAVNPDVYIGLTRMDRMINKSVYYLSSIQTAGKGKLPDGLVFDSLPPSKYLRFSYIGNHNYQKLNKEVADEMYRAIDEFMRTNTRYIADKNIFFERIDEKLNDDFYCFMEWFTPTALKQ